jgi:pimeloyl-ACP methyl ester carboxylesterase
VRESGSIVEIGMKVRKILLHAATGVVVSLVGLGGAAAEDYPQPKEADWVARDFRFHTGEVMPELRVHYTTVGAPSGEPVVVLHGTTGSGAGMLSPAFAGELFGPDQPLDATKYYIILPDAIGHGKTAKPSDSLRAKFPQYDYDDLVTAQYRLVTEGLGLRHVRLVLGLSMGGMNAWIWGQKYPGFMDALAPMASQPSAMSVQLDDAAVDADSIRNDQIGTTPTSPRSSLGTSRASSMASRPQAVHWRTRSWHHCKLLTSYLTSVSRAILWPMLTFSIGELLGRLHPSPAWSASRQRFWRSIRRMTNATPETGIGSRTAHKERPAVHPAAKTRAGTPPRAKFWGAGRGCWRRPRRGAGRTLDISMLKAAAAGAGL